MLIENTLATILSLPTGKGLGPGMNDVDATEWKAVEGHHVVAAWMKAGMLRLPSTVLPENKESPEALIENLAGYSASQAEDLVAKTYDRSLLKTWLLAEKRSKIKKVLENQLEEVAVKPGPKE